MSAVNGTIKAELQEQQPTAIEHPQLSEFNYTSNVSIAQRLQRAPLSSAYKVKQNQTGNVQQEPFPQQPILQPQLQKHIYVTDVRHQQLQYGVVPATSTNIGDKGVNAYQLTGGKEGRRMTKKTGIIISIVIVIIIGISGTLCWHFIVNNKSTSKSNSSTSSTSSVNPSTSSSPSSGNPNISSPPSSTTPSSSISTTLPTTQSSYRILSPDNRCLLPLSKSYTLETCTTTSQGFQASVFGGIQSTADKQCISYSFSNDAVNGYRIAYPYSCSDWWSFWEDGWIRSDDQGCLTAPNLTYEPCDPSNANQQWRID